jgi:hypothetical protein
MQVIERPGHISGRPVYSQGNNFEGIEVWARGHARDECRHEFGTAERGAM